MNVKNSNTEEKEEFKDIVKIVEELANKKDEEKPQLDENKILRIGSNYSLSSRVIKESEKEREFWKGVLTKLNKPNILTLTPYNSKDEESQSEYQNFPNISTQKQYSERSDLDEEIMSLLLSEENAQEKEEPKEVKN